MNKTEEEMFEEKLREGEFDWYYDGKFAGVEIFKIKEYLSASNARTRISVLEEVLEGMQKKRKHTRYDSINHGQVASGYNECHNDIIRIINEMKLK